MAKKVKITKGGQTVYPATVMDAVVHPDLRVDASKLIEEVNVSKIYPTGGIDGTNKYTLETAIAMIPASLRNVGIKCSFINEEGTIEEWVYNEGTFLSANSWKQSGTSKLDELQNNVVAAKATTFVDAGTKEIASTNYSSAEYTVSIEADKKYVLMLKADINVHQSQFNVRTKKSSDGTWGEYIIQNNPAYNQQNLSKGVYIEFTLAYAASSITVQLIGQDSSCNMQVGVAPLISDQVGKINLDISEIRQGVAENKNNIEKTSDNLVNLQNKFSGINNGEVLLEYEDLQGISITASGTLSDAYSAYTTRKFDISKFTGNITGNTNMRNQYAYAFSVVDEDNNVLYHAENNSTTEYEFDIDVAKEQNAKYLYVCMLNNGIITVNANGSYVGAQEEIEDLLEYNKEASVNSVITNAIILGGDDATYNKFETTEESGIYISSSGMLYEGSSTFRVIKFDITGFIGHLHAITTLNNQFAYSFSITNSKGVVCYVSPDVSTNVKELDIDISEEDDYAELRATLLNTSTVSVEGTLKVNNILKRLSQANKSNIELGRIGVCFGDSLMFGVGLSSENRGNNPPNVIGNILRATVYNAAIGGTYMGSTNNSFYEMAMAVVNKNFTEVINKATRDEEKENLQTISTLDFNTVDFIVIAYGVNDWLVGRTLDNEENKEDTGTICGALRAGVKALLNKYPQLRIYVMTPTYNMYVVNDNGTDSDDSTDIKGHTLKEIGEGIENACKDIHVRCLNNYNCGLNKYNFRYFAATETDNIHRNEKGYKLLGEQYAKFILSN